MTSLRACCFDLSKRDACHILCPMPDFDEQWKHVSGEEAVAALMRPQQYACNEQRVKEFRKNMGIRSWFNKNALIKGKVCLDAGCGPGRWTCAMIRMGAARVDSFDLSEEAVKRCQKINPKAYVQNIFDIEPNPVYDVVVSWGVIHHTPDPRGAFSKLSGLVKPGGLLYVMLYDKKNDWYYDGYRGDGCVEKHAEWEVLSFDEKVKKCEDAVAAKGGDAHGWFDAFNPKYNYSYTPDEVRAWYAEEGFVKVRTGCIKYNINMFGQKPA